MSADAPGSVLPDLRRAHDAVVAADAAMGRLLAADAPDRVTLTAARMRFGRAHAERLRVLNARVYPALEQAEGGAGAELRALRESEQAVVARFTRHIGIWVAERIVADWAAYRDASVPLRKAVLDGVERERRVLYPLLARGTLSSSAATPCERSTR